MAKVVTLIQAIVMFGLRLGRRLKSSVQELAGLLALATGAWYSSVLQRLTELDDAVLGYRGCGLAGDSPGKRTFAPHLAADGEIRLRYRPAGKLKRSYRALDGFAGKVINRDNIGPQPENYKQPWDADHPDDPLDLTPPIARSA